MDQVNASSDEACITKPLTFKQVPRQVNVKRLNFLTLNRQIAIDTNKSMSLQIWLDEPMDMTRKILITQL